MSFKLFNYDIETYQNLFTIVFKEVGQKTYIKFVIYKDPKNPEKDILDNQELLDFLLMPNHIYIGFNNIGFDGPIVEHFIEREGDVKPLELFELGQRIVNDKEFRPKSQFKFITKQIDLYKMWGFNNAARRTSLKWLEFTMRASKIKDLPFPIDKIISASNVSKVVTYNRADVLKTEQLYYLSLDKLKLRQILFKQYKDFSFYSKSDIDLGADTFLVDLAKSMKMNKWELSKMRTWYDSLPIKDIIMKNRLTLTTPEFKTLYNTFKDKVLFAKEDGTLDLKGSITEVVDFGGVEFKYGSGGLHASVSNKIFRADNNYLIVDLDVTSFYPNLAIRNNLYPTHLSKHFIAKYKELYDERSKIPKSNPLNLSKKLSLNAIYGKSNSKFSYLFDSKFTIAITINGQLQLTMLAEQLNRISGIIQVNTDGITVLIHKDNLDKLEKIVKWWEAKTNLQLERADYKQMVITDVNNYHATYTDNKVKRKGRYAVYDDYAVQGREEYHKNPSNLIIAKAMNSYFTDGVSIRDTVESETDIYEFLRGFKKKRNFKFLIAEVGKDEAINLSKNEDRVIRFYNSSTGGAIYKITNNLGLTTLGKGLKLQLAQDIRNPHTDNYPDLNREYYINEAEDLLNSLELIDNEKFVNGI